MFSNSMVLTCLLLHWDSCYKLRCFLHWAAWLHNLRTIILLKGWEWYELWGLLRWYGGVTNRPTEAGMPAQGKDWIASHLLIFCAGTRNTMSLQAGGNHYQQNRGRGFLQAVLHTQPSIHSSSSPCQKTHGQNSGLRTMLTLCGEGVLGRVCL